LVPPSVVETASQCPNGVARVETQHSFLNGLAAALTFSIYTPMTITVQCASAGGAGGDEMMSVPAGSDAAAVKAVFNAAAERAAETREAVFVDVSALR
jgi:hypothetical protein